MLHVPALALAAGLTAAAAETVVTVVGVSDYHSHALPFRSEGRPDQGGIARVVAYLKKIRARGPSLVLSGGDTMNNGVPAWSDEYRCAEWPWFAGLVDAMALGNHDLDYGPEAFEACRRSAPYPVLAANLVSEDAKPYLQSQGRPYVVLEAAGLRVGAFAVAGDDFGGLVTKEHMPSGTRWVPALEAARRVVEALRGEEKVDAVVFIGHQRREDDEAMARAVPGIDLVLGTHSHRKSGLTTIPGTRTRYIAPYQYLAYVSEIRLVFQGHALARIEGGLVPMDSSRDEDPDVARRVADMQVALVAKRPERFKTVGRLNVELSDAGIQDGPATIGSWATEACRRAARVHAFFSTASSFRGSMGPGPVTLEDFLQAIPYPNKIVTGEMTGRAVLEWLSLSVSRLGSDGFSQASGIRYTVGDGRPAEVRIVADAESPDTRDVPLDPGATYRIGTTDFQAYVAAGYKELFASARNPKKTDLDVHMVLVAALAQR